MKDIELPEPVPCTHFTDEQISKAMDGSGFTLYGAKRGEPLFTADQLRAAVEADRAQRVPDVEAHDELMALAERIEEARGRSICVMPEFAKVLRTLLASTPAPAQQEPSEAEMVCAEAYQVVGCLLSDLGMFETEAARKILDNLSEARMVHQDVLPWESAAQHQEPPQQERKPMMDEQAVKCIEAAGFKTWTSAHFRLVKEAERHHGIKE